MKVHHCREVDGQPESLDIATEIVERPIEGLACPKCGNLVSCTCTLQERHEPDCRFVRAAMLSVELACDHGYQACPICDPCDCMPSIVEAGIR